MAEKGVERKCRSEACGRWSFFPKGDPGRSCSFCGAEYGKVTLGLDVFVNATRAKPQLRGQIAAATLSAPRPGEFGGGR